jgi:hypothetical protein
MRGMMLNNFSENTLQRLSGKRDSNPRPLAWEANALPTELLPLIDSKIKKIIAIIINACFPNKS